MIHRQLILLVLSSFLALNLTGCSGNSDNQSNQQNGEQMGQKQRQDQHHKHRHGEQKNEKKGQSPYAGQQNRGLKAFPPKVVQMLKNGSGMPFYGMAKPAELNSYPGPKHILDGGEKLELTEDQEAQIQEIYDEMHEQAIMLGDSLLAIEKHIDNAFANQSINRDQLQKWVEQSGEIYGKLRFIHLQAHLKGQKVLTSKQIENYDKWRGYR